MRERRWFGRCLLWRAHTRPPWSSLTRLPDLFIQKYCCALRFLAQIDSLLSQRSEGEHEASRRLKTEFLIQLVSFYVVLP